MDRLATSRYDGVGVAILSGRRGLPAAIAGWCALGIAGAFAVSGLYLVKSALGIDLLPGPSPLHRLLYPLMMRG